MADDKPIRSRKKRTSHFTRFPVNGKIVEEIGVDPDAQAVSILFQDKTLLNLAVNSRHYIFPELVDYKTGNRRGIKRWEPIRSRLSTVKWLYP